MKKRITQGMLLVTLMLFSVFSYGATVTIGAAHGLKLDAFGNIKSVNFTADLGANNDIIIPDTYLGVKIIGILDDAFYDEKAISGGQSSRMSFGKLTLPSSIISIGSRAFYECGVDEVNLPEGLTYIGAEAFKYHRMEGTLTIPSSLDSIPENVFDGFGKYGSITKLNLHGGIKWIGKEAFINNEITSVTFPEGVVPLVISEGAFKSNDLLATISFSDNITYIGDNAFGGCPITTINKIPSNIEYIGSYAFSSGTITQSITIPASCKTIGASAFKNNALSGVTFADSVNADLLGSSVFSGNKIDKVVIPKGLSNIPSDAFANNNIGTLIFADSNSITSIGSSAFANNTMTNVNIPFGIENIGDKAFENNMLKELLFSEETNIAYIGTGAFLGNDSLSEVVVKSKFAEGEQWLGKKIVNSVEKTVMYDTALVITDFNASYTMLLNKTLTASDLEIKEGVITKCNLSADAVYGSIILPDTVDGIAIVGIGDSVFFMWDILSIEFPKGLKTIGVSAFSKLKSKLAKPVFNSMLETIGDRAFAGTKIDTIVIPASVKYIDSYAFSGNSTGKSLQFEKNSQLDSIGSFAFISFDNLKTLSIPASVIKIEEEAFSYCAITELNFEKESQLIEIGKRAFISNKFGSVDIPASVRIISEEAFRSCGISQLNFDNESQLIEIGDAAFRSNKISAINVPASVRIIRDDAFYGNTAKTFTLPEQFERYLSFKGWFTTDGIKKNKLDYTSSRTNNEVFASFDTLVVTKFNIEGEVKDGDETTIKLYSSNNLVEQLNVAKDTKFTLEVSEGENIQLIPFKEGYIFEPAAYTFDSITKDAASLMTFKAIPAVKITGTMEGANSTWVKVNIDDKPQDTIELTNTNADFELMVPVGSKIQIEAESNGLGFYKRSYSFDSIVENKELAFKAFVAVTISGSNTQEGVSYQVIANNEPLQDYYISSDTFAIKVPRLANVIVKPSKYGYCFEPTSVVFNSITGDKVGNNFVGSEAKMVSGIISGANDVWVILKKDSVLVDSVFVMDSSFMLPAAVGANIKVFIRKDGYIAYPEAYEFVLSEDKSDLVFNMVKTHWISGVVNNGPGALLSLSEYLPSEGIFQSRGSLIIPTSSYSYSFEVPENTPYKVEIAKNYYEFDKQEYDLSKIVSDSTGFDFNGTLVNTDLYLTVEDNFSNKIESALLYLGDQEYEVINGALTIIKHDASVSAFSLQAKGYMPYSSTINIDSDSTVLIVRLNAASITAKEVLLTVTENDQPVAEIPVRLSYDIFHTNIKGEVFNYLESDTYFVSIEKPGYYPVYDTIVVDTVAISKTYAIAKDTTTLYNVEFYIYNDTSALANVNIAVADTVLSTDSLGRTNVYLTNGNYSYEINHEGYFSEIKAFEILDDSLSYDLLLRKIPEGAQQTTITIVNGQDSLGGAMVTINNETFITKENGSIVTYLLPGEYAFEVSLEHYKNVLDTLVVDSMTINKLVAMEFVPVAIKFIVSNNEMFVDSAKIVLGTEVLYTNLMGSVSAEITPGSYDYMVQKNGFADYKGNLTLGFEPAEIMVDLLKYYLITFNVFDSADNVLPGAEINIDALESITANEEGIASIELINGTYPISVTKGGYTSITDTITVVNSVQNVTVKLDLIIGVDENLLSGVKVYPNPASDNLNISLPEPGCVSLYSIAGQEIFKSQDNITNIHINTNEFENGMYILRVTTLSGSATYNVVKE